MADGSSLVTTILTEVKSEGLESIAAAAPLTATVLAALFGISIGIKLFRKVAGK